MKIGVFATFMSPNATPSMIKDFGKRAEGLGLEFDLDGRARRPVRQEHLRLSGLEGRPHPGAAGRRHARRHGDLRLPRRGDDQAALRHRRGARAAAQPDLHRQGDLHARLAERRPLRLRHRRRLEQGRGRGLRLQVGGSRRALRRVPRGDAAAVDRAGGRLQGQVGVVRDHEAWIPSRSRSRTCRSSSAAMPTPPSGAPCSSAPAGTASTSIRRAPRACWPSSTPPSPRPARSAGRTTEIVITPPMSMAPDAMQAYAELGVHRAGGQSRRPEARAGRQAPARSALVKMAASQPLR